MTGDPVGDMATGTATDRSPSEEEVAAVTAALSFLAGRRRAGPVAVPNESLHAWRLARLAALGLYRQAPQCCVGTRTASSLPSSPLS